MEKKCEKVELTESDLPKTDKRVLSKVRFEGILNIVTR